MNALLQFLESDNTKIDQTLIEILSNFIATSKFVSIEPVLKVALPVNEIVEPIVFKNHRWHQFVRSVGSFLTLKHQEKETELESNETNWQNELLLNLRRMGFNVNEKLELNN